jgi:hypothetical protein
MSLLPRQSLLACAVFDYTQGSLVAVYKVRSGSASQHTHKRCFVQRQVPDVYV